MGVGRKFSKRGQTCLNYFLNFQEGAKPWYSKAWMVKIKEFRWSGGSNCPPLPTPMNVTTIMCPSSRIHPCLYLPWQWRQIHWNMWQLYKRPRRLQLQSSKVLYWASQWQMLDIRTHMSQSFVSVSRRPFAFNKTNRKSIIKAWKYQMYCFNILQCRTLEIDMHDKPRLVTRVTRRPLEGTSSSVCDTMHISWPELQPERKTVPGNPDTYSRSRFHFERSFRHACNKFLLEYWRKIIAKTGNFTTM